ncbi:protease modulator HflC [Rickettsiella grylli]|uniref:HflC protein n=1 Tax=Rickettsiella grylli TaxID=59196 RepID=A8PN71_9COXI|nr:protease modulator HflC [Rickettsiella grylli]EDP46482.1 putative HflC protein [Rickettsiella grylli]
MSILRKKIHFLFGALIVLFFILYRCIIIIPEGYTGLVLSEEKSVHPAHTLKPGIHFIIPFFMRPILLDSRLQTFTVTEVGDEHYLQKYPITIAYYVNWFINHPRRFYKKTKNNLQSIKQQVHQQLTALFRDKNTPLSFNQLILKGTPSQMKFVLSIANKKLEPIGIKLTQIGFQQLVLSPDVRERLVDAMRTQQETNAIALRAEGKANAELIRAHADHSATLILAQAREKAAHICAQGDAEAAKRYNQAYTKNPTFARLYLDLQIYQRGFKKTTKHAFMSNMKDVARQNDVPQIKLTETNTLE